MKFLMYFLTVVLGTVGLASLLRFVERVALGAEGSGSPIVQLTIGSIFVLLAYRSLAKARGKSTLTDSEGARS